MEMVVDISNKIPILIHGFAYAYFAKSSSAKPTFSKAEMNMDGYYGASHLFNKKDGVPGMKYEPSQEKPIPNADMGSNIVPDHMNESKPEENGKMDNFSDFTE